MIAKKNTFINMWLNVIMMTFDDVSQGWASPSHDSDSSRIFLMTLTWLKLKNWETLTRLFDSSQSLKKIFIFSYKKTIIYKIKFLLTHSFRRGSTVIYFFEIYMIHWNQRIYLDLFIDTYNTF
jgi:hypothetical protein